MVGTPGADTIRGTDGPDVIVGLGGSDSIRGLGGDDVICAGANTATFRPGPMDIVGGDWVVGGPGDDRIAGGPGIDHLQGSGGNDRLYGGQNPSFSYVDAATGARVYLGDVLSDTRGTNWLFGGRGVDQPKAVSCEIEHIYD